MKHLCRVAWGTLLASGLAACSQAPVPQYRLTASQLAWQPYQAGQVLRFGNDRRPTVRRYTVLQATDELVSSYSAGGLLASRQQLYAAEVKGAQVQRTDTVAEPFLACSLSPDVNGPAPNPASAICYVSWDNFPIQAPLPVDEVNKGMAFDTAYYGATRLLPVATLGGNTYHQVLQVKRYHYQGSGPSMVLYYTKNQGVVAFEEVKTGLWYRLP